MGQKPRILIVEDEEAILQGLSDVFTYNGYEVETAKEGPEGLEKALHSNPHLIILDIMLPGMDGFEICNRVREVTRDLPIIMLTARSSDDDIVAGLKLGADDYIPKPFSVRELLARVEAVLRRSGSFQKEQASINLGDLRINPSDLSGTKGSETIPFTRREIEILTYLHQHAPRPISRKELLREVWGYQNVDYIETRTIDIHITKLRRKVEPIPTEPKYLVTVRGEGYRLDPSR